MPKGPRGEKRPADAIGLAVLVGKIATGEVIETLARKKGSAGGTSRAQKLEPSERREIAQKAAAKRWQKTAVAQD